MNVKRLLSVQSLIINWQIIINGFVKYVTEACDKWCTVFKLAMQWLSVLTYLEFTAFTVWQSYISNSHPSSVQENTYTVAAYFKNKLYSRKCYNISLFKKACDFLII